MASQERRLSLLVIITQYRSEQKAKSRRSSAEGCNERLSLLEKPENLWSHFRCCERTSAGCLPCWCYLGNNPERKTSDDRPMDRRQYRSFCRSAEGVHSCDALRSRCF